MQIFLTFHKKGLYWAYFLLAYRLFLFSKTAVSGLFKPGTEFYSTWIFDLNDDSRACWTALGLNLTILVSSLSEVVNTSIWYIRDSSKRKIINILKVVTSEKIGGSGVTSTQGTWYGGVVMGVLLSFNEATILYRDFTHVPSQKQNIIVFAANNSRCCECHVAPTIIF